MCQVCAADNIRPGSNFRKQISEFYETLSATLLKDKTSQEVRDFYVETLRKTADEIETNVKVTASLKATLDDIGARVDAKRVQVEAALLVEEGKFYQTYGVPMPQDIRDAIRLREWDAREEVAA